VWNLQRQSVDVIKIGWSQIINTMLKKLGWKKEIISSMKRCVADTLTWIKQDFQSHLQIYLIQIQSVEGWCPKPISCTEVQSCRKRIKTKKYIYHPTDSVFAVSTISKPFSNPFNHIRPSSVASTFWPQWKPGLGGSVITHFLLWSNGGTDSEDITLTMVPR